MDGILERIEAKLDQLLGGEVKEDTAPAEPKKRTRSPNKKGAVDLDMVKEKMKEVLDQQGRKVGLKLLKDFDAEKLADLEESQYEDFFKACEEALEEAD